MKINKPVLTALVALCLPATVQIAVMPASADSASLNPIRAEMSLGSTKALAPGEPILVHYMLINESPTTAAVLSLGDTEREWYTIKAVDSAGHPVQASPKVASQLRKQEGLYQPSERMLLPGQKFEGDIVANNFLAMEAPGQYSLHVDVSLYYVMTATQAGNIVGTPSDTINLSKNFAFTTTLTSSNPATVRAKAEALRRQLMPGERTEKFKTVSEELFAMPEAIVLPTWQSLVADPATDDFVLTEAAEQLSTRPSRASADLVAQMLWERGGDGATRSPEQIGLIWKAISKMYDSASPDLKPYIRSLYIKHGVPAYEMDQPHIKSHPN